MAKINSSSSSTVMTMARPGEVIDSMSRRQVDPYCTNIYNQASYISSANGCQEVGGRCPAAALDQCGVRHDYCTAWHETLQYKDCDGDAYLDPVCTTSLGDGISIYRSAELCHRTDLVQCVKPVLLPSQKGSEPCPMQGLTALTLSQCEIAAKMQDLAWGGEGSWYAQEGCIQQYSTIYYNKMQKRSALSWITPWCLMTYYLRATPCPGEQISNSECSSAAARLHETFHGTIEWWNEQAGCLWTPSGVYFNTDGTGGRGQPPQALSNHNPAWKMICRINDFSWVQRTLVADEGNHLASGGYTNIEDCNLDIACAIG